MTVKELIKNLSSLREELQSCDIVIVAENGTLMEPEIKFLFRDKMDFSKTKGNVKCFVLTSG